MGLTQQTETDPAVTLRGTQRGLEVEINPGQDTAAIVEALRGKLLESPGFWSGSNVILRFLGDIVPNSLGDLERVCAEFDLKIVGIRSPLEERNKTARAALAVINQLSEATTIEAVRPELAEGSVPVIKPPRLIPKEESTPVAAPAPAPEPTPEPELALEPAPELAPALALEQLPADAGRFVRGPIRSGVILEATEHLIICGDVNPGAEVRSLGAIIVLGRLRGVAHAGAGGFILALELAPQQLRLGELVARAADADSPPGHAEIAHARGGQIIVEMFRGSLPRPLWSLFAATP